MSPSGFVLCFFCSYYTDIWPFLFTGSRAAERSGAGCWSLLDILPMVLGVCGWWVAGGALRFRWAGTEMSLVALGGETSWRFPSRWASAALCVVLGVPQVSRGPLADGRELNALGCVLLLGVPHSVSATWSAKWELGARLAGELSAYCPCFCSMQTLQAPGQGMKLRGRIRGAPTTGGDFGWVQYEVNAIASSKKGPLAGISL